MSPISRRQLLTTALVAPAALTLGGCSFATGSTGPISERRARVVSTTGMINDLVLNIGGDRVDAKALMGAGVDPHLFKASERTLRTMERADLVLYNGLHLEGDRLAPKDAAPDLGGQWQRRRAARAADQ